MGGGLVQLVAKGSQDLFLTGNPQISYFKTVYRRYTNFATECIQQRVDGDVKQGSTITSKLSRDGDLISNIYFEFESQATDYPNNLGNYMFEKVDLLIGDQLISSLTGHYMYIHSLLTQDFTKNAKYTNMINPSDGKIGRLMIPLPFWFCNNPGQAIPLIALQYSEVVLNIEFKNFINNTYQSIFKDSTGEVWVEYIYLDTDERRRFAQVSHEYLIEQVQVTDAFVEKTTVVDVKFNNSIKELIFACDWYGINYKNDNTDEQSDIPPLGNYLTNLSMTINGHNLFKKNRSLNYFTRTQIYDKHSGKGYIWGDEMKTYIKNIINNDFFEIGTDYYLTNYIGVYSFALRPEEHQPTGTLNFSTVNDCKMIFEKISPPEIINGDKYTDTFSDSRILKVYGINYNILRIMSGIASLAYQT
jgi:hypothetical protein